MKFVVTVLVLFVACLFSLSVLAKLNPPPPLVPANNPLDLTGQRQTGDAVDAGQDDDILRLGNRLNALEGQRDSVQSAMDAVARARLGKLEDRVKALEDAKARLPTDLVGKAEIERMIAEVIKAAGGTSVSQDASSGPEPPAVATGFNFDQKLGEIERILSARLAKLHVQITALNNRLRGVERQLSRRAIRFDAGGFGLLSRGFMAAGGLGAITWPLGQDGDWAVRFGAGAGQGWDWADKLESAAWLAKADLLYRWESIALGLTGTLVGGAVRDGNRYLSWGGGATARVEPWSWLFIQASAVTGAALGTYAPIQWMPIGGIAEAGVTFP